MYHYELYMGSYYLKNSKDDILNMCDEIGLVIADIGEDTPEYMLLKHGCSDSLTDYYNQVKDNDFYDYKIYLLTGKFPVEELNKILDNISYINSFLEKYNLSDLTKNLKYSTLNVIN